MKEKRADFSALIIIGDVFHNVSYFASKNFTENFDGMGTDTFVPLQSCNLPRADIILLDKSVLRNAFLFHNIPEIVIRNHDYQPPSLLDMITEFGV